MNTFLPLPDIEASVACLDRQRLGKQRVEAMQLLKGQWSNHPASKMWRGHEAALAHYMNACIKEWIRRGYSNTMLLAPVTELVLPPWFGDPDFHARHRSNLLRKDPVHYGQFGWSETPDLPYIWPLGALV